MRLTCAQLAVFAVIIALALAQVKSVSTSHSSIRRSHRHSHSPPPSSARTQNQQQEEHAHDATSRDSRSPVTWTVIHGMDNGAAHDILTADTRDVSQLEALCLSLSYCAGFSTYYGTLKLDLNDLGVQSNTDLFVRNPPPPPLAPPLPLTIWPFPAVANCSNDSTATLSLQRETFDIQSVGYNSDILSFAIERYLNIIFAAPSNANAPRPRSKPTHIHARSHHRDVVSKQRSDAAVLNGLDINVLSESSQSEDYNLTVPSTSGSRASLSATSVVGALRGLETFSQLVTVSWNGDFTLPYVPIGVQDKPQYPWRALMIDSSRHFLPLNVILLNIEAMAAAKMNVFHWHLSDSQSFSFGSTSFPLLWRNGSFDPKRAVYSHNDIRTVIDFAAARGIRVVPEFDMPAHTDSWLVGYPFLSGTAVCSVFDPTLESTYEFVDQFLGEVSKLFPDPVIHLGGDELGSNCWIGSATITAWMAQHNLADFAGLETYWIQRVHAIAAKYNRTVMLWHDPYSNGAVIPLDVIIEVWGGGLALVDELLLKGYQVVYAAPFYLDHIGDQWSDFYTRQVSDGLVPPAQAALMLGVDAPMWAEWVDATNILPRVWPRAAAVAEIAWSDPNFPKVPQRSVARLHHWRCRQNLRGIPAEPVGPWEESLYYCNPV